MSMLIFLNFKPRFAFVLISVGPGTVAAIGGRGVADVGHVKDVGHVADVGHVNDVGHDYDVGSANEGGLPTDVLTIGADSKSNSSPKMNLTSIPFSFVSILPRRIKQVLVFPPKQVSGRTSVDETEEKTDNTATTITTTTTTTITDKPPKQDKQEAKNEDVNEDETKPDKHEKEITPKENNSTPKKTGVYFSTDFIHLNC